MKKYAFGLIFLSILALIACVVITTAFEPLDTLMKPPKIEGENLEIQLAFEKNIGKNYLLKQPVSGSYRSAYSFVDISGDGENEVVVFYSMINDLGIVRMNILDKIDGIWKSVADFESVYNDIQEIAFSDLNGDGRKEIIVGWIALPNSNSKLLSVYEIKVDTDVYFEAIYSGNYSMFKVADIDCDGNHDILSINQTYVVNTPGYSAFVLKYNNGKLSKSTDFDIDKSFSSLAAINFDNNSKNTGNWIYIDGYNSEGTLSTDCIRWDEGNKSFERCLINGVSVSVLSSRVSNVLCKDINSDGIIEIPTEKHLTYFYRSDDTERGMNFINWVNIGEDNLNYVTQYLMFTQYGFSYNLIEDLSEKICVENNSDKGVLTFYSIVSEDDVFIRDKKLFSIAVKSEIDLESISELSFQYTEVSYVKGRFYFCRLYDAAEEFGITNKEVKNRIIAG